MCYLAMILLKRMNAIMILSKAIIITIIIYFCCCYSMILPSMSIIQLRKKSNRKSSSHYVSRRRRSLLFRWITNVVINGLLLLLVSIDTSLLQPPFYMIQSFQFISQTSSCTTIRSYHKQHNILIHFYDSSSSPCHHHYHPTLSSSSTQLFLSTTSSSSSSSTHESDSIIDQSIISTIDSTNEQEQRQQQNYDQYTVKELKQYIKDNINFKRGLLTKLQKKQDIIDFLIDYDSSTRSNVILATSSSTSSSMTTTASATNPKDIASTTTTGTIIPLSIQDINTNKGINIPTRISTTTTNNNSKKRKIGGTGSGGMSTMAPMMPPITTTTNSNTISTATTSTNTRQDDDYNTKSSKQQQHYTSPKEYYVEEVYQRYPPIREIDEIKKLRKQQLNTIIVEDENDDEENDNEDHDNEDNDDKVNPVIYDIRQQYHPIFRNSMLQPKILEYDQQQQENNDNDNTDYSIMIQNSMNILSKSDMDIIFIGTASCSPGITRGTSCTALRLNWQRKQRMTPQVNTKQVKTISTSTSNYRGRYQQNNNNNIEEIPAGNGIIGTWLFDVGECTQLQIQRTSSIKAGKITKIFLTHAHGDHTFGLPGLLCLMGTGTSNSNNKESSNEKPPIIEIYGPEGLRMWLRVAIRYSVSRIVPPYVVHEIMNVPMAPEWEFHHRFKRYYYNGFNNNNNNSSNNSNNNKQNNKGMWGTKGIAGEDPTSWISKAKTMQLEPSSLYGEMEGGRDIYPDYNHPKCHDGAPIWKVIEDEIVNVYAAPMSHGIPCIGYCIEEVNRPGRLKNEVVEPIVRRNIGLLKDAGYRTPMMVMGILKNLKPNTEFTFPDKTIVTHDMAVEPPRKGRKIVICGDTSDSRAMTKLANNADVIVHEATNAYLPGVGGKKQTNYNDVARDCIIHGHSTPQMAGKFCKNVNGTLLILNHFSSRYKGDISSDSLSILMRIEKQAMLTSGLNETQIAAAWDFMILPIPQH